MNALTRQEALKIGKTLNLPDVVFDIIQDNLPDELVDYFSSPVFFDLSGLEQDEYGFGKILPLWANANGNIIFAYDFYNNDYFSFFWDGNVKKRFDNWDDLIKETVAWVMEIIWDDQSENEVLDTLKEIFSRFNVRDIEIIFKDIIS